MVKFANLNNHREHRKHFIAFKYESFNKPLDSVWLAFSVIYIVNHQSNIEVDGNTPGFSIKNEVATVVNNYYKESRLICTQMVDDRLE